MNALMIVDPVQIALVSAVLCLIALIIMSIALLRQAKLLKRYRGLLNGQTGADLETILLTQQRDLTAAQGHLELLDQQIAAMMANARRHTQKTAIVRFNAFPDTGSDLSFAIALLDADNSGVIISSLYGRSESRTYAKPIQNGKSTYALSDEEKEAIAKAIG